jgi:hypothetical protein
MMTPQFTYKMIPEARRQGLRPSRPKTITFCKYPGGSGAEPPRGLSEKSPLPGEEKVRRQ